MATTSTTSITQVGVVMFAVSDVDAAKAYYVDALGFEVRGDDRFGPEGEHRWLEVAPPGSTTRIALNPPMGGEAGGGAVGVECTDLQAEHERLRAADGVDVDDEIMAMPGAPAMFSVRDPDGNSLWVTQAP